MEADFDFTAVDACDVFESRALAVGGETGALETTGAVVGDGSFCSTGAAAVFAATGKAGGVRPRDSATRRTERIRVAFSTITMTLAEPHAIVEPGVFAPLGHALRDSLQVLAQSLAGLVYLVVALSPWLVLAYVVYRAVKAVRARRKVARAEA